MDSTQKTVGLLVKKSSTFVRAAFYLPGESFWRKTTSRKKWVFHIFLKLRVEINLTRNNLVCSLLKRLRFLIVELLFEIFFQQCRIFSPILGFQYELLPYLAQKFRHSGRKCILRVQAKVWRKIGFRLQSVKVFKSIWTLHKSLSEFSWESAARWSGLHYTSTTVRFEKNTIVSKNMFRLSLWDLEWRGKKFDFWQFFVPTVVKFFYSESRKQQFDFFGTIFIQLSFLRSEQELLRLFTQNIWHVCWNFILCL